MPTLTTAVIGYLLEPFLPDLPESLLASLSAYLDLLLKWNARTNLTAIRTPEEIVKRHFGESLFAGLHLPESATLLDYGTGAGFPGLPIALMHPEVRVTLAESQNKKVSFLREAVRSLGVSIDVWPKRVEEMPSDLRFDCVTLRAVDDMEAALRGASLRSRSKIVLLTSQGAAQQIEISGFQEEETIHVPESSDRIVTIFART
ncbi:16S rRNA (guanine(527)-N(7))-methyltransferase RsmG [Granulicella sibirica]|uniref:Ribosomal RNA small subunit methyltransferase G n=1 Tax=Granulicella sibirica TaxID=2479048 RepID=A0A4Q0T478_9BACT|nr:16S rRNA (guanine(527)-N(7))-methyltransferase RsmG [Granulicella sibirica]RXH58453.1 rRNA small subunit 7-methylguanosine (m7G) methyltransferase GidB [Granulicella sibirica]